MQEFLRTTLFGLSFSMGRRNAPSPNADKFNERNFL
ncbi:hypothetical protein CLOBOL_01587 [Enterocloster bolteae ATCC BAA-613]|uniref:Uncharacterized protein n=1 Tax=Enterocloster bolteae (strain ATCC BAA-613 / DSM 15670 / CCUG 46953 / JCM 12243 / WAL 16351) TaxID=411902 RepID=A8RLD9_ENTBW|nr:hypothetical protein CLOBOL_01587 [Enterocloster bolteae ATCC BAA-613]